ncbi:hypothetical protein BDF22DRAFT_695816 [Syncephalis plumigaleata]|nr:hypothetical protein BDF22DRAFT_695816 [Syncephalis plumigaleata]
MHLTAAAALVALYAIVGVSAHGHLSYPPCRGCDKYYTSRDSINSPLLTPSLCRGEPAGVVTKVEHALTLKIDASAPHKGPCSDCAAPGVDHTWAIDIPSEITGRKVLRWTWDGCHVQPCEKYEQCSDINIGGGSAGYGSGSNNNAAKDKPLLSIGTPVGTISTPNVLPTASDNDKPTTAQPATEYSNGGEDEEAHTDYNTKSATYTPNGTGSNGNVQTSPPAPSAPAPSAPAANAGSSYGTTKCGGSQYTCNGSKFGICDTNTGHTPGLPQTGNNYYCKPVASAY